MTFEDFESFNDGMTDSDMLLDGVDLRRDCSEMADEEWDWTAQNFGRAVVVW